MQRTRPLPADRRPATYRAASSRRPPLPHRASHATTRPSACRARAASQRRGPRSAPTPMASPSGRGATRRQAGDGHRDHGDRKMAVAAPPSGARLHRRLLRCRRHPGRGAWAGLHLAEGRPIWNTHFASRVVGARRGSRPDSRPALICMTGAARERLVGHRAPAWGHHSQPAI